MSIYLLGLWLINYDGEEFGETEEMGKICGFDWANGKIGAVIHQ